MPIPLLLAGALTLSGLGSAAPFAGAPLTGGQVGLVAQTAPARPQAPPASAPAPAPELRISGALAQALTPAEQELAAVSLLTARDRLNLGGAPWPCASPRFAAALLPATEEAYQGVKAGLLAQGYGFLREVEGAGTERSFQFGRGEVRLLGQWSRLGESRALLALCQQGVGGLAAVTRPEQAPSPGAALRGINRQADGRFWEVAAFAYTFDERGQPDGNTLLLARGELSADSRFRLPLPGELGILARALQPVARAVGGDLFLRGGCDLSGLKVSDPQARGLGLDSVQVLRPEARGVTDPARLAGLSAYNLRSEGWSPDGALGSVRLVYTSRPVRVSGAAQCGPRNSVQVDVNLGAGWNYVQTSLEGGTLLIANAYPQGLDLWGRWDN